MVFRELHKDTYGCKAYQLFLVMRRDEEKPVNAKQAREELGWSSSYMSAVRRAMGIRSRYFFLSDVRRFIRANPSFTSSQIYHRKNCQCANCQAKRSKSVQMKSHSTVTDTTTGHAGQSPVTPPTSELAHHISLLKGTRTTAEVIEGAAVSRETFRKIERGQSVKLSTVKKVAKYLGAGEQHWRELVVAWIKLEIGKDEAKHIRFSFVDGPINEKTDESEQVISLVRQLDPIERKQILMAIARPEVHLSLPALNNVYDNVKRKAI